MEATMTRNGQITIPKDIREKFDLKEGSKILFIPYEDGIVLQKMNKRPWEIPGESGFTDEIVENMRKYRKESKWRYP